MTMNINNNGRGNIWSLIIQATIAILTALSGVFAGGGLG